MDAERLREMIAQLRDAHGAEGVVRAAAAAAATLPGVQGTCAVVAREGSGARALSAAGTLAGLADREVDVGGIGELVDADVRERLAVHPIGHERARCWLAVDAAPDADVAEVAELESVVALAGLVLEQTRAAEMARREARGLRARYGFLIRGVSHDLKNPIGAIDGYVQLLEAGVRGELTPGQREWTQRIGTSLQSMLVLINDLLDLARVDSGALQLDMHPLPLGAVVREAAEAARANLADGKVEITVNGADKLPPVMADLGRARQVVDKLLFHALRTTSNGSSVTVAVSEASSSSGDPVVQLRVTGDAHELPAEQRARILEGLVRVEARDGRQSGTGLELALARRMARAMKGDLAWSDEDGSALTLSLPVARPPD